MKLGDKIRIGKKIVEGCIFKRNSILSVEFSLTYRCNLKCGYCGSILNYTNKEYYPTQKEMSVQEIKKVFLLLSELNVERINISGGEPLIRDDIAEILESIFPEKFKMSLATNGILVPKYIDILANLDLLIISIDGKKDTHDYVRGKGSYDAALKAIDLSRGKGIKLLFSAVITHRTTEEDLSFLLKLCNFYDTFCFLQPVANRAFFYNRYEKYETIEKFVPPFSQFERLCKYLKSHQSKRRIVGSDDFLRFILDFNKKCQQTIEITENCMAGILFLRIAPDGTVFPCTMRYQRLLDKQIQECSLEEIKKIKTHPVRCPGCSCYSYRILNKIASFDLKTILHSLRNSYI